MLPILTILLFAIAALAAPLDPQPADANLPPKWQSLWTFGITVYESCSATGSVSKYATLRNFRDQNGNYHTIDNDKDVLYNLQGKNTIVVPDARDNLELTLGPMERYGTPDMAVKWCTYMPTSYDAGSKDDHVFICGCHLKSIDDWEGWCWRNEWSWGKKIQCDPERYRVRWYECWFDMDQLFSHG
ncbi:hypothetical protein P280DRAFT_484826 [Massarina eburnea CBS 473.64]|uniref:Uncharacterized protein n=1 Tax=Massarina eburnea CBS 473.64 TaxID=1395130 RepID=A0A6A6RJJ1_9PLEO|nr:hypothetical protein P280DRAFT_484826 [Massarina eburnea CBS 473.64]